MNLCRYMIVHKFPLHNKHLWFFHLRKPLNYIFYLFEHLLTNCFKNERQSCNLDSVVAWHKSEINICTNTANKLGSVVEVRAFHALKQLILSTYMNKKLLHKVIIKLYLHRDAFEYAVIKWLNFQCSVKLIKPMRNS